MFFIEKDDSLSSSFSVSSCVISFATKSSSGNFVRHWPSSIVVATLGSHLGFGKLRSFQTFSSFVNSYLKKVKRLKIILCKSCEHYFDTHVSSHFEQLLLPLINADLSILDLVCSFIGDHELIPNFFCTYAKFYSVEFIQANIAI